MNYYYCIGIITNNTIKNNVHLHNNNLLIPYTLFSDLEHELCQYATTAVVLNSFFSQLQSWANWIENQIIRLPFAGICTFCIQGYNRGDIKLNDFRL